MRFELFFFISLWSPVVGWSLDELTAKELLRPDLIQIVSPKNGLVVHPGDHVRVKVKVAKGHSYAAILLGGKTIGLSPAKTEPPYTFDVIVGGEEIGPSPITAVAMAKPGEGFFSAPVLIDVEPKEKALAIKSELRRISFKYPGEKMYLSIDVIFKNERGYQANNSTRLKSWSTDETVATVDKNEQITAVGPGNTTIEFRFDDKALSVPVSIPKTIRGDLDGSGEVTQDDLNILRDAFFGLMTTEGRPLPGGSPIPAEAFDARDVNHDRILDQEDLNIVRRLIGITDLKLSWACQPKPARAGQPLTCAISIKNQGPDSADRIEIHEGSFRLTGSGVNQSPVQKKEDFELTDPRSSISPSNQTCHFGWSSANNLGFGCFVGNLPNGQTGRVEITFTPKHAGQIAAGFQVYSKTFAKEPKDRQSSITIPVIK